MFQSTYFRNGKAIYLEQLFRFILFPMSLKRQPLEVGIHPTRKSAVIKPPPYAFRMILSNKVGDNDSLRFMLVVKDRSDSETEGVLETLIAIQLRLDLFEFLLHFKQLLA